MQIISNLPKPLFVAHVYILSRKSWSLKCDSGKNPKPVSTYCFRVILYFLLRFRSNLVLTCSSCRSSCQGSKWVIIDPVNARKLSEKGCNEINSGVSDVTWHIYHSFINRTASRGTSIFSINGGDKCNAVNNDGAASCP